ncbi:methyltransferase domain-containing protein [Paenibacillus oenotherae]|uniref:Methyltransferase domain-containing protein n=1 Tax=Paenibacillus oenotherae TaxID=1435645 RepID=A0ABS7D9P0_9BACL|nr:class I SAM-dependent methyltransferase [Paenibacillus oenotherae]MBW7476596.1 methyltransferase domain-containing protein [Paenibacillus oenotherae]
MGFLSVLSMAHKLISERVSPGDTVIDATCGNGVDTRFLAELVGARGTVFAFDIQAQALQRTDERLAPLAAEGKLPKLHLVHDSHAAMASYAAADQLPAVSAAHHPLPSPSGKSSVSQVAAVMFNLGYLPGADADPSVITQPDSTLAALDAALSLLRPGGIVTAVVYPGHAGGDQEAAAVAQWAAALPQHAGQAISYRMAQKPDSPYLIAVEKR